MRERMTIGREQLHAIGDPTRWRILGRLQVGPASIQQLANGLGRAKGTVGHHVRVLERAGLIRLADTKQVRGVVEKRYTRVARHFMLPDSPGAPDAPEIGMLPIRAALAEARLGTGKEPTMSVVVRARMPAARARRFARLIEQLAEEFATGAPDSGEAFGFVGAIYIPDWSDRSDADPGEPPQQKEQP